MTVLSDRDIKKELISGRLVVQGIDIEEVSLACVDLSLGNRFRIFKHTEITHIDTRHKVSDDELMDLIEVGNEKPFIIHPGELVLGITKEYIKIPDDLVARLDGRSSLGRLGVVIHSTSGSVDPGFEGYLTLEIANISKVPVVLWPGSKIARLTFDRLSSPCETPYNKKKGAKYYKQTGPWASKIGQD